MSKVYVAPVLSAALDKFRKIVAAHAEKGGSEGRRLIVFCEDRLSLVAERAVCEAVGGTFSTSVYTLSRFLVSETGGCADVLTSQGSAMAIRKLIEEREEELQLFKRLSAANAAQEVYDTIALLYSSKISPDDLDAAETDNNLLRRKLHDLSLLYRAYSDYLKERGAVDRNAYLRRLPDVIRGSEKTVGADVLFFGFQAFTSSVADCVRACMETADDVSGIFIGGSEKKYVNEAWTSFVAIAREVGIKGAFLPDFIVKIPSPLNPVAERLRKYVFEPESFHMSVGSDILRGQLNVAEAADEDEECQYIAAQILRRVKEDGIRYRDISVMFPDVAAMQPSLERAFVEYGIPFYVDRRYPLITHSACTFILDYLACAADGCRPESVLAVVGSSLFTGGNSRADKDAFVNYYLRAAGYRGGVRRAINPDICREERINYDGAERVRNAFLAGLKILPSRETDGGAICKSVRKLIDEFNMKSRLEEMAAEAEACGYPSVGVMSARAYEAVEQVIAEAEKLTSGEKTGVREFAHILRSGFSSAEISLIPPKQDAVFVGDLSACVNAGSKVLFAGGLTDAVPAASQDTAILTDGELVSLEKLKIAVSPKISQVNKRVREITALNFCAFSEKLYLTYPLRSGGEECGVSEVIAYVKHLARLDGKPLEPVSAKASLLTKENFPYYCAKTAPAWRRVTFYLGGNDEINDRDIAAAYKYLKERGADLSAAKVTKNDSADFRALYGDSVSPTALENYFACPYRAFLQQGLRLSERREGAFRPLDSGNFIHAVLEEVARKSAEIDCEEKCAAVARETAERLLKSAAYSVQADDGGAKYAADALVSEAEKVSVAAYLQLKNSSFGVESVEERCKIELDGGLSVGGRIDRVDVCGDMVRIIDYKTGSIDDGAAAYYQGLKLQLPLYLSAVSEGRRAAGAYYFPANLDYSAGGSSFTLKGFMDGSDDVVRCSDSNVQEKEKSVNVGAYLNGRKTDKAMSREDFADFLDYSREVASEAAREMTGGEIYPSPVEGTCKNCKFRGCCGYDAETGGEREEARADCKTIAEIARRARKKGAENE